MSSINIEYDPGAKEEIENEEWGSKIKESFTGRKYLPSVGHCAERYLRDDEGNYAYLGTYNILGIGSPSTTLSPQGSHPTCYIALEVIYGRRNLLKIPVHDQRTFWRCVSPTITQIFTKEEIEAYTNMASRDAVDETINQIYRHLMHTFDNINATEERFNGEAKSTFYNFILHVQSIIASRIASHAIE